MAAGEGEKVEEKGAATAKKEQIGVDVADEEKGARVVEKGEMGVKATNKDKGLTAEGEMIEIAVEKGEDDSTAMGEEEGEIAEGKGKGKKREPAVVEKDLTADLELEWKWKVKTIADGGEGSKTRREPRRWRIMRRDQGAMVEKEKEEEEKKDTAAATEKAGEKTIFLFSADAATRKMIPQVSPVATTTAAAEKMITLVSSKGQPFMMSEAAARLSVVLADMIDNGCASGNIPLSKVDDRALTTVIKYCNKHAAPKHDAMDEGGDANTTASNNKKALDEWDRNLVRDLTQGALYDLIIAARFLNIKELLADMIKKKTPAQICKTFGIANDFTAEEEEMLRNESPWVFDGEEDEKEA